MLCRLSATLDENGCKIRSGSTRNSSKTLRSQAMDSWKETSLARLRWCQRKVSPCLSETCCARHVSNPPVCAWRVQCSACNSCPRMPENVLRISNGLTAAPLNDLWTSFRILMNGSLHAAVACRACRMISLKLKEVRLKQALKSVFVAVAACSDDELQVLLQLLVPTAKTCKSRQFITTLFASEAFSRVPLATFVLTAFCTRVSYAIRK